MNLRYKLIAGFLLSAILVAVVGYVSLSLNRNIRDRLVRVNSRAIYLMEYTGEMSLSLHKSLMFTQEYLGKQRNLASGDEISADKRKEFRFAAREAEKKVQKQLERFEQYAEKSLEMARQMDLGQDTLSSNRQDTVFNKAMIGRIESIQQKYKMYESLLLELFKLSEDKYQDGQELLTVTLEPFFRRTLMPLIDSLRSRAHKRVDQETVRLEDELDFAAQTILFVGLVAFFTAIVLGYMIYRQISDPLNKLTESTKRIGEGNLDERIEIESEDELGVLATSFNDMVENLDETTVSKNYFNDIIQSLSDALVVVDENSNILKVNQALQELSGYESEELHQLSVILLFDEEEQEKVEERLQASTPSASDYIETLLVTKDDRQVQVSFASAPLTGRGGEQGYVCLISDITERKEAEEQIERSLEEKKVLLAEIHHRVKNNLAVISSLLQMQLHNTQNKVVQNILKDSVLRIQSIALIHEKLYQSDTLAFIDYDNYIKDLVSAIEESFSHDGKDIEMELDFSSVSLNVNQAIPCSLFINEVLVNCYKHAFVEQDKGAIQITMREKKKDVVLKIQDDGVGLPDGIEPEESESLGMTLIHTLTKQLKGDLTIYNNGGAVYKLEFPIE